MLVEPIQKFQYFEYFLTKQVSIDVIEKKPVKCGKNADAIENPPETYYQ